MLEGDTRQFDDAVRLFVHAHSSTELTAVMRFLSIIGSPMRRNPDCSRILHCSLVRRPSPPRNPHRRHSRWRKPVDVGLKNRLPSASPGSFFQLEAPVVLQLSQRARDALVLSLSYCRGFVFHQPEESIGPHHNLDFLGQSLRRNRLFANLSRRPLPQRCPRRIPRGSRLVSRRRKRLPEMAQTTAATGHHDHARIKTQPAGNKNFSIGLTRPAQLASSCVPPCTFSKCIVSPGRQPFAFSLRARCSTSRSVRCPS